MTPGVGGHLDLDGRRARLTSLDRVLWPDTGMTKAQLIDYYIGIAPVMLPHLADRPLTLHRYPEGVYGNHFFQTRCPPHPPWVRTVTVSYPRTGKTFESPVIDDLPGLVWAANLATIEFHPFLGRTASLDSPTAVVFDLDPGPPAGWIEAGAVVLRLHALLRDVGLDSWPKTSGIAGVHVFVPVGRRHTYDDTKAFARAVARLLTTDDPAHVTDRMAVSERTGKAFVDWSQNDPGKSTVAAYSLRGMAYPTVSMPVTWEELAEAVRHRREDDLLFAPSEATRRVANVGNLFAPVLELEQQLPVVVNRHDGKI
jgi:bifunctional non-homologous end joining protein LigD